MSAPNGFFVDDLMVFPLVATRGFELSLPDLSQAKPAALNEFNSKWEQFFLQSPPDFRFQIQAHNCGDFQRALDTYTAHTEQTENVWAKRVRSERHARYTERLRQGKLVRQRTVLFISVPLADPPGLLSSPKDLSARYRAIIEKARSQIQHQADSLARLLAPEGAHLTALSDLGHFEHLAHVLNPSLGARSCSEALFSPQASLHANCWWSEATGTPFGFLLDGHYHAIRALAKLPARVSPLTFSPLWQLPGPHYRFTVNVHSLDTDQVIAREERELRRLESQYRTEKKPSLTPLIEAKRRRIETIVARNLRPFVAQSIYHTWARNLEELLAQAGAIEERIHGFGGHYFAPTLPTTTKRLFLQAWPGFPWGDYRHYYLRTDTGYQPYLLPLHASFSPYLDDPHALYENPQGGLVGLRGHGAGHTVVVGNTGSGKSMLLADLISQLFSHVDLIRIVDHGNSHEPLVQVLQPGTTPYTPKPNGGLTVNYLDTNRQPLTPQHLADQAGMVSILAGATDEREDRLRRAIATEMIMALHHSRFNTLEKRDSARALELGRMALAIHSHHSPELDAIEAFIDFRDFQTAEPREAAEYLASFSDAQVLKFLKEPATRPEVVCFSAAQLSPKEAPTHRELQERLLLHAKATRSQFTQDLATLLRPWCASLFDGASTTSADRKLVCWELGQLRDESPPFQLAVRHLVNSQNSNDIYSRPRSERKLLVFEEASAFLDLPGADLIVRRAYEQARKFNATIVTVFQQYSRLVALPIRAAIMGNARQFILLKQDDPTDLTYLRDDLGLPNRAIDEIKRFPKPSEAGHAAFLLFCRDTPHPVCGVAHHVASKEMFFVTCTTPEHVDSRKALFRSSTDALTAVCNAIEK